MGGSPLFGMSRGLCRVLLHLLEKEDKSDASFADCSHRGLPKGAEFKVVL